MVDFYARHGGSWYGGNTISRAFMAGMIGWSMMEIPPLYFLEVVRVDG